ncbi:SRPBCC family protein [Nocardioides donggukensis]|uniref:SRPBCC family protein n=1 Tax=Nocardioides donggukensis TaxID=2774019 RepID=A0A927K4T8_9ACTN|nr:SRPBCC family protein [Nocardioides donggukensis]MBD8868958.1 SRPBCC family protein [Nocardioides donggukensis]
MAEYTVTRTKTISAEPERIQALVDDFHAWTAWSPWEDLDPDLRREYSGPESGVGAHYAWEGNRKAGKGQMEITGSSPERVDLVVQFEKPWKACNPTAFVLRPVGDAGTEVTWTMSGENKGVAAVFAKVMNMDKLIGRDFEKGLDRLAMVAEADPTGEAH